MIDAKSSISASAQSKNYIKVVNMDQIAIFIIKITTSDYLSNQLNNTSKTLATVIQFRVIMAKV